MDRSPNSSFDNSDSEKAKFISRTVSESEECVIFQQLDMYAQGFVNMEEIRRQGKLCDVTLNVGMVYIIDFSLY